MHKVLDIDGKKVGFNASALTPRLYRHKFGRDFMRDVNLLRKKYAASTEEDKLDALDLEIFENIAYMLAWQYDPTIPDSPDEWLDGFEMFSIYIVLPEILQLWLVNEETTSKAKKA